MAAEKQWKGPQVIWPGTAKDEFARKSGRDWPTIVINLSAAPTAISRLCADFGSVGGALPGLGLALGLTAALAYGRCKVKRMW